MISAELIKKLPKQDLHLHLDGSIKLETMIAIAKEQKIKLPSYSTTGLEEILFKDRYANLEEYLKTFEYSCAVMQTPENLEKIAYELAIDCQAEGVCYIEIRLDPLLVTNSKQSSAQVLKAVDKGLKKAQTQYNNLPKVKNKKTPSFQYGLVICVLRFAGRWSEQYNKIYDAFPSIKEKKLMQMISLEQVSFALKMREQGLPIIALDLAGSEKANPCNLFQEAYQLAIENSLHTIAHAGEADDITSIEEAVYLLKAERIGHGTALFDKKTTQAEQLIKDIKNKNITIEVCLTSNLQTLPQLTIQDHSYQKMISADISICICTDNRTVSKTSATKELLLAKEGQDFHPAEFKKLVLNGFEKSFLPNQEKKEYCKLCEDYYDFIIDNFSF